MHKSDEEIARATVARLSAAELKFLTTAPVEDATPLEALTSSLAAIRLNALMQSRY